MSLITRRPKTAGTVQFQTEVAANAIAILDTEVDNDFDDIYRLCNGNLDNDNISGSPTRIAKSKLNLDGSIVPGDLAPSFTIPPSSIPPNTITLAQLALGAAVQDFESIGGNTPITVLTQEMLVGDLSFTLRGTSGPPFLIVGILSGSMTYAGTVLSTLTAQIRFGGNAGDLTGTVLGGQQIESQTSAPNGIMPINVVVFGVSTGAAGPHRAKLTVQQTGLSAHILSFQLIAIQWA